MDWCKFFSDIEKDPFAKVPSLTVRQFFEGKEHARACKDCYDRIERTVASNPDKPILPSFN